MTGPHSGRTARPPLPGSGSWIRRHCTPAAVGTLDRLVELPRGELQTREERVRMAEEELAGRRQRESRTSPLDQPLAELHLERAHLLRDRGLRERERRRRARERPMVRDLAEGEQPPRIQHRLSLSQCENHYLR